MKTKGQNSAGRATSMKSPGRAFVTTEMQRDSFELSDKKANETSEENGEDILDMLSGVARGVQIEDDHGILARAEMEKYALSARADIIEAVAKPRSARDSRARPVQHCARESRALRSLAKGFATASIVTRNPKDFVGSRIRVLTPSEFLTEVHP